MPPRIGVAHVARHVDGAPGGRERLHHHSLAHVHHSGSVAGGRVGGEDRRHHPWHHHVAAVAERRVADRDLQRARGEQTLADGHVDLVAEQQLGGLTLGQHPLGHQLGLQRVVGDAPVELARQVDAGVAAKAELADVVLQHRAAELEELLAEPVEEHVARHRQRPVHVDIAVHARPVVEVTGRVAPHALHAGGANVVGDRLRLVRAPVVDGAVRVDDPGHHRRVRDERFERRAEVVLALDRPVRQHRLIRVLAAVGAQLLEQFVEPVVRQWLREPPVVERRVARHRHDLAGRVVHDDHRAGRRRVVHAGSLGRSIR